MNGKTCLRYAAVLIFSIVSIQISLPTCLAFELSDEDIDIVVRGDSAVRASIGYRVDSLDWNIAGDQSGQNPNVYSELEFDDMKILQAGIETNLVINRIYSRVSIYLGEITDGNGTDSDYDDDNRQGLWSRSESAIDKHDVIDVTGGLGYEFDFFPRALRIAPLVGVSYHEQNICIKDGIQTVSTPGRTPDIGPFSDSLNSTYETQWKSLWFGMDIHLRIVSRLFLSSSLEYHIAKYEAKADWNLIDEFKHPVSFTHEADGRGIVSKIGISYTLARDWDTGLTYTWNQWNTEEGEDHSFPATGGMARTKLNEVNWDSQALNLSCSHTF